MCGKPPVNILITSSIVSRSLSTVAVRFELEYQTAPELDNHYMRLDFSELLCVLGSLMCNVIFESSNAVMISYKHQARCIGIGSFQGEKTLSECCLEPFKVLRGQRILVI